MKLYKIRNWNSQFENNRTRDLKNLEWVPIPNSHDGDGFTDLLSRKNGMALFGAWILILELASKCNPRGVLIRDTHNPAPGCGGLPKPHTPETIARVTRGQASVFEEAIPVLIEIGWLEFEEQDQQQGQQHKPRKLLQLNDLNDTAPGCDAALIQEPHQPASGCGSMPTEGKGSEEKGSEEKLSSHSVTDSAMPPEVELWNSKPDLPKVTRLSSDRKRHLAVRRKDQFWVDNFPGAIVKALMSDFCMGRAGGDRKWKISFDFMLKPGAVERLIEGKYDNIKPSANGSVAGQGYGSKQKAGEIPEDIEFKML